MPFDLNVLYQWKPGVSDARIAHHFAKIRALRGSVPGLVDVRVGSRTLGFSLAPGDHERWTHGGVMTFDRKEDYAAFGASAAHDQIAPDLVADLADLMAVGFDT